MATAKKAAKKPAKATVKKTTLAPKFGTPEWRKKYGPSKKK